MPSLKELGEWATVIGVPLIVITIIIAGAQLYWQIREAKSEATDAKKEARDAAKEARNTREAIERTELQLANNHLLFRAGEMERLRDRLDRAVVEGVDADVSQIFRDWPGYANDSIAILKLQRSDDHADAIGILEESISMASRAKDQIIGRKSSLADASQMGREQIDRACTVVAGVASTLKFSRSV
jgi:hypothetical protein